MPALVGRTVCGSYRLRKCLGEGAFGGVFLSDQYAFGLPMRRVALKLSHRTRMSEEDAREVLADALLLAEAMDGISDARARPHLVHVYDAGIAPDLDGRGYLTMEYVEGTTLADVFRDRGRVPESELLPWVTQMCTALRGLHLLTPPLLHRDLKPDNVLLGKDNVVRLVDFGLSAKLVQLGHVPGVAGTLTYMAPETLRGKSMPASDVYSVGLLIYEGLTGRHPFDDLRPPPGHPDALHGDWLYEAKRRVRAVPPSQLNNTVTERLDEIVLRCLEVNPDRRFRDAAELLGELNRETPTETPAGKALRESRDRPATGDLDGARNILVRALAEPSVPAPDRFELHRELGELLSLRGEHSAAAAELAHAWKLTEHTAILRTRSDRAALLGRIADCHRLGGNVFQQRRWERRQRQERGADP
jgi:serine/threonine protein kinase